MGDDLEAWQDRWWQSADGLRLHYRDYPGEVGPGDAGNPARPPVLCLPGLTRNARDFATLAGHLSSGEGGGWRVLCAEMRGRGLSQYAEDAMTYTPLHYIQDVLTLLDQMEIERVVAIGTSLGGLMTLGLGMIAPERIAGAVLNDIGPVIEPEGLAKIGTYVGSDPRLPDWQTVADYLKATFAEAFPDWDEGDWLAMAHRVAVPDDVGSTLRFDYDPRIVEPMRAEGGVLPDLWPGLEALATKPLLFVRGGLSDLFSAETLAEMGRRAPGAEALTLPRVGHAPTLAEPGVAEAITRLLAKIT